MTYRFRPAAELYWGVLIAVSLVLLQALFVLEPAEVADWQVWAVAIGGAAIRAGAGAALDYLRRSTTDERTELERLQEEVARLERVNTVREAQIRSLEIQQARERGQ